MADRLGAITAPYHGTSPRIDGPLAFAGTGAAALGRVTLGKGAWLGAFSVVRADGHYVEIGDDFHLDEHGTVHIAHDIYPTHIGRRVTAGRGAVIHACDVGDDCVVGAEAVILDGAKVGPGAVVAGGSIVFPRSVLAGGWLYAGNPAKPVAQLSPAELAVHHDELRSGRESRSNTAIMPEPSSLDCWVAPSASVRGDVRVGEGVGVWYGCALDAGSHRIEIGDGTNVQDNTVIRCEKSDVAIAGDVTIGHNVTLIDCRIEADTLIGIGALVSPGTVVERDVLLAAGAVTEPGQRLAAGQVWAGRPARPIGKMDDKKRSMVGVIVPIYRSYAADFRKTPHTPL